MKFCSECGKRFEQSARFCPSCGVELKEIIADDNVAATDSNTAADDINAVNTNNTNNNSMEDNVDDKGKSTVMNQSASESKKGIKLTPIQNIIAVVIVIIFAIGGYMYKSPEQQVRRVIDGYMSVVVLNSQLENPQVEDLQKAIEYVSDDVAQSYMKEIEDTYSKKDDKEHTLKINSDPFHFYYYKVRNWEIRNISIMNDKATVYLYMRNYVDYPEDKINQVIIITMENKFDKWCITAIENEKESGDKNE